MNKHDVTTWNPVTEVYKNVTEREEWEPPTPSHALPRELQSWARRGAGSRFKFQGLQTFFAFILNPVKPKTVILIKTLCVWLPIVITVFSFGVGCVMLIKEEKKPSKQKKYIMEPTLSWSLWCFIKIRVLPTGKIHIYLKTALLQWRHVGSFEEKERYRKVKLQEWRFL